MVKTHRGNGVRLGLAASLVASMTAISFAWGCGPSTPCEEGLDRLHDCGHDDAKLTEAGKECSAFSACVAKCVTEATCDELRDTLAGDYVESFNICVSSCDQEPHPSTGPGGSSDVWRAPRVIFSARERR